MRKLIILCMAAALSIPISAMALPSSYNRLSSEEQSAFNQVYKESSNSSLKNVSVSYSSEVEGLNNVNNYHWTAWKKTSRGSSIPKNANSGNGIGSGNYKGITTAKINSWSREQKYIDAIKRINNGRFPERKDYPFPTDTSSSKLDWWVGEVGFYDILGDPRYSKIIAKGYRTFNWTEKVKKEKQIKESISAYYKSTGKKGWMPKDGDTKNLGYNRLPGTKESLGEAIANRVRNIKFDSDGEKAFLDTEKAKNLDKKLKDSLKWDRPNASTGEEGHNRYQMNASISDWGLTVKVSISGHNQDGGIPNLAYITVTRNKTETYYEEKSHTSKQQIAQTVLARNAYATEISKYKSFFLVPKSQVSNKTIKKSPNGFWMNTNPYYHNGENSTVDEGNFNWTYSNQVTSGKTQHTLWASIKQKHKLFQDVVHDILFPPETGNPPLNPGGGTNTPSNPNNPNFPGGGTNVPDGNNPGGNGNNPNNPNNPNGGSSIGDKDNHPMINVEVDAKTDDGGSVGTVKVAKIVHLVDIYGKRH